MKWLFWILALLPFAVSAQVEVRRYATMTDLLSANPSSFAVAGRATVVVTGRTNLYDGWSRVLAYSSSDTNAADNQLIFSPSNTNFPGRYRLLYLENATNSAVRAGVLPPYGSNSFWYNGAWVAASNLFVGGANASVSVATNGVVSISSTSSGEPILWVDAARVTNGILSSSQFKGSDISWAVEAETNVVGSLYNGTVTFAKIQGVFPSTLLGGTEGGAFIRDVSQIQLGANLQMVGDTLSAIVPASTNSWQIEVGGVLTIEPDLVDTGRIDVTASGSSVSFDLVPGSVSTNYLSAGVNTLLNAHNLAFTVNGTTVVDPNVVSSEEIAAAVSASTNVYFALNPGSVALSKLTNMVASRLLGRGSSGLGAVEPITVGTGLVLGTNGVLSATGTNSTVVRVGGTTVTDPNFLDTSEIDMSIDLATNISASLFNNSVVFSKLQQIATSRLLGRSTAGSGNIEQILIGSGLSLTSGTLSATGGGGGSTNGTAVYVDGASVTGPNFTDASTTGLFDVSGTNVTIRLPDRDFGDITVGTSGAAMTIDADSVALGTDTTGNYVATIAGTANEVTVSGSGSETAAVTLSLPTTVDLGGKTSFEVPNSTGPTTDAVGEIAVDSNAWATSRGALQIFDGTANTFAVGVLASDTPSNGQVPKWNTGGTITWEDDSTSAGGATNIGNLLQVVGTATFSIVDSGSFESISGLATSGSITNLTFDDGSSEAGLEERGLFTVYISPAMSDTNYIPIIEIEAEDPTGLGSPIGSVVYGSRTTTGFRFIARFSENESIPVSRYRVWLMDDDASATASGVGTVTNVAMTTSLSGLSVSGSPITSGGTLTLSGTLGAASIDAAIPRLANAQTFTGASNIFTGDLHIGGTLNVSTQIVDLLVPTQIDLGTNIVAIVNGGTSATNAAGALSNLGGQPLDADLTAMAAGTAVATAQTNAVSVGAPVLYVGSTNVAAALASMGGGGGDIYAASNNVFTASNTFSGMVTLGGITRSNWFPSHQELYLRTDFLFGSGGTLSTTFLPWVGSAISSGTSAAITATSNHVGQVSVSSAAGANSGYTYQLGSLAIFNRPGDFSKFSWRPQNTNAGVREYLGFLDTGTSAADPTDGVCFFRSNNFVYGKVLNNSTLYQTSTSVNVESNVWYTGDLTILSDSSVLFRLFSEDGTSLWSDTLSCSVAVARGTGHGTHAFYTNAASAVISQYDFMDLGNYNLIRR